MSDDFLSFAEEDSSEKQAPAAATESWKVLLVDDEKGIHTVTKLALSDLIIEGRPLEFLHAYSGKEALEVFREHKDIAMCLLDVVMESDHAGLDVARIVRKDMENTLTRIILRTGQPGQAPERKIITEYDINGYKEKSELTATRLYSTAYTMICAYRDLQALTRAREALARIITLTHELSNLKTVSEFATAALDQLSALLGVSDLVCVMAIGSDCEDLTILAANGEYAGLVGAESEKVLSASVHKELCDGLRQNHAIATIDTQTAIVRASTEKGAQVLLRVATQNELRPADEELVQLYCESMALAIEKIQLRAAANAA